MLRSDEDRATVRTVTRTIRIAKDTETALSQLSDSEQVSVNHIVNEALRKWTEWDYYAQTFGNVSLPTALIKKMLEYITEEEAAEMGRWTAENLSREFVMLCCKEFSAEALRAIALIISKYNNLFKYDYTYDSERHMHTTILTHGMGRKWSIWLEHALRNTYLLLDMETELEVLENQLVVRIPDAQKTSDV